MKGFEKLRNSPLRMPLYFLALGVLLPFLTLYLFGCAIYSIRVAIRKTAPYKGPISLDSGRHGEVTV